MHDNATSNLVTPQPAPQAFHSKRHSHTHNLSPSEQFERDLARQQWLENLVHWLEDLENGGSIQ
jgi:hypothetical protein